jgi:hypothetical protein
MMQARLLCSLAWLFLPALPMTANAACTLSQSGANTLTVTYGGKDCPRSAAAKEAFARNLKLAVAAMNAPRSASKPDRGEMRTSAQQRLYNLSDLHEQSDYLNSRSHYYGQR